MYISISSCIFPFLTVVLSASSPKCGVAYETHVCLEFLSRADLFSLAHNPSSDARSYFCTAKRSRPRLPLIPHHPAPRGSIHFALSNVVERVRSGWPPVVAARVGHMESSAGRRRSSSAAHCWPTRRQCDGMFCRHRRSMAPGGHPAKSAGISCRWRVSDP